MGLSIGLDTAVKALRAHQVAVDTASHNIANANTPGFSRQRVLLRPLGVDGSDHFTRDSLLGRVGFGVEAKEINRIRDIFLDFQARQAISGRSQWQSQATALGRAEVTFNEPGEDGLAAVMGKFWVAWHDVANDPEASASRTTLTNTALTMTSRIQRAYNDLQAQRSEIDRQVGAAAGTINAAASEIAELNFQIKQVEITGDNANDLRDRRDLLLDQLSATAQISYSEQEDSTVTVYLGSHELVTQNTARLVEAKPDANNGGLLTISFKEDGEPISVGSGSLKGLLDTRDSALPTLISKLNQLATGVMTAVNAVHSTGFGLDGSTGNAFFTGTDASDITVNAVVAGDPRKVAAASATAQPGDGSIALAIADIQRALTMTAGTESFDQFYLNLVGTLGADAERARGIADSTGLLNDHLEGLRSSVQGVSIDEEVTNLNQAQHAYNAAARVISVIDEMLDTLINRTGV